MRGVLMYHSIDDSGSPVSLSRETFARHVAWLESRRTEVLPLTRIVEPDAPPSAVALTFDDAFENFATDAWPRLRDGGLPVTVFVVTDRCGKDNRWGDTDQAGIPTLPLLDWDALGKLAEEGVTLGNHSRRHPRLATLDPSAVEDEVSGAREMLHRRTGVEATTFAYPYGNWSAAARDVVRKEHDLAVTTELREVTARDDRHLIPRLDAYYLQRRGRLEAWGTGDFRRRIRIRAMLRRVRGWARVATGASPHVI